MKGSRKFSTEVESVVSTKHCRSDYWRLVDALVPETIGIVVITRMHLGFYQGWTNLEDQDNQCSSYTYFSTNLQIYLHPRAQPRNHFKVGMIIGIPTVSTGDKTGCGTAFWPKLQIYIGRFNYSYFYLTRFSDEITPGITNDVSWHDEACLGFPPKVTMYQSAWNIKA